MGERSGWLAVAHFNASCMSAASFEKKRGERCAAKVTSVGNGRKSQ